MKFFISYPGQHNIFFHTSRAYNVVRLGLVGIGLLYDVVRHVITVKSRLCIKGTTVNSNKRFAPYALYTDNLGNKTKGIGCHRYTRLKNKVRLVFDSPLVIVEYFGDIGSIIVKGWRLGKSKLRRNVSIYASTNIYIANSFGPILNGDLAKCLSYFFITPCASVYRGGMAVQADHLYITRQRL